MCQITDTILVTKSKPENFNWSDKTVLIAEDDALSRKLISLYLSPTGLNILWAKNGAEALELVRSHCQTDLALIDIQMPVLNGFEVARVLKRDHSHIPIIIQTAYAIPEYQRICSEIGCEVYLTKPFERTRLLEAIQERFLKSEVA